MLSSLPKLSSKVAWNHDCQATPVAREGSHDNMTVKLGNTTPVVRQGSHDNMTVKLGNTTPVVRQGSHDDMPVTLDNTGVPPLVLYIIWVVVMGPSPAHTTAVRSS